MTTRSAVITAAALPANFGGTIYTCPAASIIIVKQVLLVSLGSAAVLMGLYVHRTTPTVNAYLVSQNLNPSQVLNTPTWTVLEPGDQIRCDVMTQLVHLWVSGAVLPAVTT